MTGGNRAVIGSWLLFIIGVYNTNTNTNTSIGNVSKSMDANI